MYSSSNFLKEKLDKRLIHEISSYAYPNPRRVNEAHIPAQYEQKEGNPWVPEADEHCRWPESLEAPTG